MTFLLPNTADVKEIDRTVELLRTVSKSLRREAERALVEYDLGGEPDGTVGAHRERRQPANYTKPS